MKKILIFGGTTEGRELSYLLSDWGIPVAVSVVTEYGQEAQGNKSGIEVYVGAELYGNGGVIAGKRVDLCGRGGGDAEYTGGLYSSGSVEV